MRLFANLSLLILLFTYSGLTAQGANFVFVDASADVDQLPSLSNRASGPAWGDFNNDGFQDLYLATFEVNTLYLNNGDGTFSEVSLAAAVNDSSKSKAATWGDMDNDGFLDIYISNDRDEPNKLYLNNGDGTFIEIAQAAGVDDRNFAQGGAWADFDKNSTLDFYLLQDDSENRLFSNQGTFSFSDVAPDLGLDNEFAAYGIAWLDYNDDNNSDLFVTNCRNFFGPTWTNLLYRNNGDGSFTDVSAETGLDYYGESWGTIAFDFDNDLDMDILVTNTDLDTTFLLYENQDTVFTEVALQAGLENIGGVLAVTSGDYDNDGDIDVLVVGFDDANRLYQNQGDGTFRDITEQIELPNLPSPRYSGTATADYDNDGFLDFVIADERSRAYLFHNQPPDSIVNNNWLLVSLRGLTNNHFGIGAKITAVSQELQQVRHVIAGSGTYSEDMIPVHFGFGLRTAVDTLMVRWPNGVTDLVTDIGVNQLIEIEEGGVVTSTDRGTDSVPETFELQQNYPNPFNPSTTISFTLLTQSQPVLRIYNILGELVREFQSGPLAPGVHQIQWDSTDQKGKRVASGIYLYRLHAGNRVQTKKMILSR